MHDGRAQHFIEEFRRLVPVEHRPFEPPAFALRRYARHLQQHGPAEAAAAMRRTHVQIFQAQTFAAKKGGEIVEVHGEGDGLRPNMAEQHFGVALLAQELFGFNANQALNSILGRLTFLFCCNTTVQVALLTP